MNDMDESKLYERPEIVVILMPAEDTVKTSPGDTDVDSGDLWGDGSGSGGMWD